MNIEELQKTHMLFHIISVIPEQPVEITKVIPEVRLRISELGGRNVSDTEMIEVFKKLADHKLVSFDQTHIRRLVKIVKN